MSEMENDPLLLSGFFDETIDSLATAAGLFVDLERSPTDMSIVEAIFRPVHSLKGNSSFFGFTGIKSLAHDMETVLDHIRKGRMTVSQQIISTLLAGLDGLRNIVDRLKAGKSEIADPAAYDALIEQQRRLVKSKDEGESTQQALLVVETFLKNEKNGIQNDVTEAIQQLVTFAQKKLGITAPVVNSGATNVHPILGELQSALAISMQQDPTPDAVARMEMLIEQLEPLAQGDEGKKMCLSVRDTWQSCIGASGFNDILRDFIIEQIEPLAVLPGFAVADQAEPLATLASPTSDKEEQKDHKENPAAGTRRIDAKPDAKSVRISESRIDTFLHYVGELLVVGDMFNHMQSRVRQVEGQSLLARDFRRVNDTFAQLSNKLQVAIMSIRKVPIRPTLAKVPRIIRDVAVNKSKEIAVVMRGEEVEVDKSLVDLIDAPLTHMARNAADHGIELPAQRLAAGKKSEGQVTITVEESSRAITLTITDDGAGLNLERIRAKGESLGLVKPGAELTEKDLINMIFASGLSTAEVVSDVSGRGVGMDVVKRMIDEAGGTINVTTERGQGTVFRLSLPKSVTTQIVPAFMVRVGPTLLALPLERVRETFLLRGVTVTNLPKDLQGHIGGRVLIRHDETLTLLSMSQLLKIEHSGTDETIVTIDSNGNRIALAVSEVVGVRKIVVRNLDGLPVSESLYAGGAMLGDGAVALIINPDALMSGNVAHAH